MLAEHGTAQHVERIVRARTCIDVEEERRGVRDRHARTDVWCFWDDDGSGLLYAWLDPEDAATVRKALDAAKDHLRTGTDGSAEPPRRDRSRRVHWSRWPSRTSPTVPPRATSGTT